MPTTKTKSTKKVDIRKECANCKHYDAKTAHCNFLDYDVNTEFVNLLEMGILNGCSEYTPTDDKPKTKKKKKIVVPKINIKPIAKSKKIPENLKGLVPKDVKYYVEQDRLNMIWLAMSKNLPITFEGHTGLGKSELARYIAQEINAIYVRIQFNGARVPDELIGYDKPIDGSLVWWDGTLSHYIRLAQKNPSTNFVLCLDEWNAASKSVQLSTRSLFDESRNLSLSNQQHEILYLTNNVYVFATLNPSREFALYPGIERLNEADKDRFPIWSVIDFPDNPTEMKILKLHFPDKDKDTLKRIITLGNKARKALKDGLIQTVVSTRTLIHILKMWDLGPEMALKECLLGRMSEEEQKAIAKQIDYIFDIQIFDQKEMEK